MAVLVTSEQVCEMLGITPNNLYQIVHRKQLTWVGKNGKNAVFDKEQVEALKTKRDNKGK
jgi:predicted site-specific integrase-resolvase